MRLIKKIKQGSPSDESHQWNFADSFSKKIIKQGLILFAMSERSYQGNKDRKKIIFNKPEWKMELINCMIEW